MGWKKASFTVMEDTSAGIEAILADQARVKPICWILQPFWRAFPRRETDSNPGSCDLR